MLQEQMFPPNSDWRPPRMSELPEWSTAKRIGLDIETCDPHIMEKGCGARDPEAFIVGVSFCLAGGRPYYLPFRHKGGDNLPAEQVLRYLKNQAAAYTGELVGANIPYDLDFLAQAGIIFHNASRIRDVQIAEPLLDELQNSYSLQAISERWGFKGKNEKLLQDTAKIYGVHPKGGLWQLPARYVGPYAEEDARLPLQLIAKQEEEIKRQDLWNVYELESKLQPVLLQVRRRGVDVDIHQLEYVEHWAQTQKSEALLKVYESSAVRLGGDEVWNAEALEKVLNGIGFGVEQTATGQPHIDKMVLAQIQHDAARGIEQARKVDKLLQFAAGVREHLAPDGRIHCTYNQLRRERHGGGTQGAAYGRLSCTNPNLQQQPARDEFGAMWRAIYLPKEGELWAACDYSQQEPRMTTHYASLALTGRARAAAIQMRDAYRNDPATDNHSMMAKMAGIDRKHAKAIFLGLCYGMGGAKLCEQLGLPTKEIDRNGRTITVAGDEGQALLNAFDQRVPYVKALSKAVERKAVERGYITTLSGRRCRFPVDKFGNYDWTYKALNRLIQGAAADQTKTAMVQMAEAGFDIMAQVHDEVAVSVKTKEEAEAAADIMRHCVELELPSKVDVEIGKSWGGSMGYE